MIIIQVPVGVVTNAMCLDSEVAHLFLSILHQKGGHHSIPGAHHLPHHVHLQQEERVQTLSEASALDRHNEEGGPPADPRGQQELGPQDADDGDLRERAAADPYQELPGAGQESPGGLYGKERGRETWGCGGGGFPCARDV